MAGFKSFARPVRLELARGITGFVGPNGSGKSNVVDAIRWCLGEQSARDLRAQRSEDVIYAGRRKVLGAAEVTMTFESEPGDDVPWAELAIGRRLYRSGESEYLMNRRRVRLRDLMSALRTVGIDAGRNVVVTQGMADALLAASPAERRGLLEQAAGLGPYRERRDEARAKLTTTRQNIETIEAVLGELEPRLRILRRQARAVQERDEARQALHARSLCWFAYRWRQVSERAVGADRRAQETAGLRQRLTAEIRAAEEAAAAALARERARRDAVEGALRALHMAERERDAAAHEVQRLDAATATERERLGDVAQRRAVLDEAIRVARERARTAASTVEALASRQHEAREAHRTVEERFTTAVREWERLDAELKVIDRQRREVEQRRDGIARQRQRVSMRLEDECERADRLDRDMIAARDSLASLQESLLSLQGDRRAAQSSLEAARREEEGRRSAVVELEERLAQLERLERRVAAHVDAVRARESAAAANLKRLAPQPGALLEVVNVQPGWEHAVAAALGERSFVPPSELRAGDVHSFLTWRAALGSLPAGAVWADVIAAGLPEGTIHPLLMTVAVAAPEEAASVWDALAGKPALTVGLPALQVVAADGTVHDPFGARREVADERAAGYLRTKYELEKLAVRAVALGRRLTAIERARETRATDLGEVRAGWQRAQGAVAEWLRCCRELDEAVERTETSTRRLNEDLRRLEDECAGVAARREALHVDIARLDAELVAVEAELKRAIVSRQESESRRGRARQQVDMIDAARRDLTGELSALSSKLDAQAEVLKHAEAETDRIDAQLGGLEVERESLTETLARLQAEGARVSQQVSELDARVAEHRAAVDALGPTREGTERVPDIGPLRECLAALIGDHERAVAELRHIHEEQQTLKDEIGRDLGIQPAELPPPPEFAPADEEIRRLRNRANQYADADPGVVEECRDLDERRRHLSEHVEDLRTAIATLEEMMTEADAEMRERFERAYEAVNEEFSRVFRVMLRGGDARLERNGDGVDIWAQLPGKRLRSSAAFSGGERSLVASALLFGVLKIRPTPFCVLDEVDAALDENNVDRYLSVLRDIAQATQIMVVTHNRATMAAADVLYGLTMDDEGASSVLSLRLDAYATA